MKKWQYGLRSAVIAALSLGLASLWNCESQAAATYNWSGTITQPADVLHIISGDTGVVDSYGATLAVNQMITIAPGGTLDLQGDLTMQAGSPEGTTMRFYNDAVLAPGSGKILLFGNEESLDIEQLSADDFHKFSNSKIFFLGESASAASLVARTVIDGGTLIFDVRSGLSGYFPGHFEPDAASTGGVITILSHKDTSLTFGSMKFLPAMSGYGSKIMIGMGGETTGSGSNLHEIGGTVVFNGSVDSDAMEVESSVSRVTEFRGPVDIRGRLFLDGAGDGSVRFYDSVSAPWLEITGSSNYFMGDVDAWEITVFDPVHPLTHVREGETRTVFSGHVDTTGHAGSSGDVVLGGGNTTFEGIVDLGASALSVGFDDSTDSLQQWSDEYHNDQYATGWYLNNSSAVMVLGGSSSKVTAGQLTIKNSGTVRLMRDVALVADLKANGTSYITLDGQQSSHPVPGGVLDVGTHTLHVSGSASFGSGSTIMVTRSSSDVGKMEITGTLTVEQGVRLIVAETTPGSPGTGVNAPNSSNSVMIEAASLDLKSPTIFDGDYTLRKEGNTIILGEYTGSTGSGTGSGAGSGSGSGAGAGSGSGSGTGSGAGPGSGSGSGSGSAGIDSLAKAAGADPNGRAATALVGSVLSDPSASPALVESLNNYGEMVAQSFEGNPVYAEKALAQLAGGEALSSVSAVVESVQAVNSAITSRFAAIHENAGSAPAAGYGDSLNRVWMSVFKNWARQKQDNRIQGYTYDSFGFVIGYDRELDSVPGLTVGVSGGWSDGEIRNADGFGKTDISTFNVNLYSSFRFAGGFFIDGLVGYGRAKNEAEVTQMVGGARKRGQYDSSSFQAGLNIGHDFHVTDSVRFTPSVGMNYVHVTQDDWQETVVADPLNTAVANWFGKTKRDFLEIPVMLALRGSWETASGVIFTPELRAGVAFTAHRPNTDIQVGFVGSGHSTVVRGIEASRTKFLGGVSLGIQANDTVDVFIDYNVEARSKYVNHSGAVGIGFSF
jgi:outer membrane autotransporter protein